MNILFTLIIYICSFIAVWFGADLLINSVSKLAKTLRLPAFTLSFVILGLLTSLPELAIGITAIKEDDPQIFVGNLIGAVIVLFLCIIPLLAITGNRVHIPKDISVSRLLSILVVVMLPTIFAIDRVVENWEGLVCIGAYILLVLSLSRKRSFQEKITSLFKKKPNISLLDLISISSGIILLIVASNYIVDTTLYFAELLKIAPFFVSLIVISLGTNIPELSIVLKSMFSKKHDIALADFLGSASVNTLLFGVLSILYPMTVTIPNYFIHRVLFLLVGLTCFFIFARSKNTITKREAIILLFVYFLFIFVELYFLI